MAHPTTKAEILTALESNGVTLAEYFSSLTAPVFFHGDSDRWSPGHHLVHLTQVSASVERALRSGALGLHPSGRSRSYAEIRDAAASSLADTPKDRLLTMGRTVVLGPGAGTAEIVRGFTAAGATLRDAAASWSEEAMDRHALTHPLMGVLTVREMLLFCVVHERHHLRSVQTRLSAGTNG